MRLNGVEVMASFLFKGVQKQEDIINAGGIIRGTRLGMYDVFNTYARM
jgi:hypothetical protein